MSNTQTGLQNQMFGVFLFLAFFGQVIEQILPLFVSQRTLYEARERPSKTYSWKAFLAAQMMVEFAWNSVRELSTSDGPMLTMYSSCLFSAISAGTIPSDSIGMLKKQTLSILAASPCFYSSGSCLCMPVPWHTC
jgi:hypothetical protein